MKDPLYTYEKYSCDGVIRQQKVNCEHWSVDEKACSRQCSLKGISPSTYDCHKCDVRKPMSLSEPVPLKITPLTVNQYGKSVLSQMINGKVSQETYDSRAAICMKCEHRRNPSPQDETVGWCNACGCGNGSNAALSRKLWMPKTSCPHKFFGPARGEGFTIADAKDAVQNIKEATQNLLGKPDNGA